MHGSRRTNSVPLLTTARLPRQSRQRTMQRSLHVRTGRSARYHKLPANTACFASGLYEPCINICRHENRMEKLQLEASIAKENLHGRATGKRISGHFPGVYAYNEDCSVSAARVRFAEYLLNKGVTGLYVGGSSGECIYQSVEERKTILETVMDAVGGKLVVIAHVACNNTADSCEPGTHAERLGVDAIAAIRRSISICRRMPSRTIGTPSLQLRQTRILSFILSRLAGVAPARSFCRKWLRIAASSASKTRLCRRRTSRCGAMRPSVSLPYSTVWTSS